MKKNIIRLTESELRSIIKEAVKQNLNEIGETEKGQRALGALSARKKLARNPDSKIYRIYKKAEQARGGDNWDVLSYPNGTIEEVNPLYPAYAYGYKEYLDSHPDEMAKYYQMKESTKLSEGMNDDPNDTHYAVHKPSGKIVFSWDYSGYDNSELRMWKKDYFYQDLLDMEIPFKDIAIWTRNNCIKKGIDPSDDANWTNSIVTEAFSDIVQHNHIMANNKDMYDAYVLIDNSDEALIGNYNDMNDAIEDADYYARNNKYGSYSVVGCIGNEYDLNDEKSIIYTAE